MPRESAKSHPDIWVLLRGLTRESGHWGDFPKRLEEKIGCRVLTLDLPGTGIHHKLSSPTKIGEITDFLRQQLAKYQSTPQKVSLLALSMGGLVAMDWMARFPEDLERVIIVNASARGLSPLRKRLSWIAMAHLTRMFFSQDLHQREERILRLTTNRSHPNDLLVQRWVEIQDRHPVSRRNAFRQLLAAARFTPADRKSPVPLLVLNSLGDHLVHPDCSDAIRTRWSVPMKRHAWAGHDIPLEDPTWVIHQLVDWLGYQSKPSKIKDLP